MGEGLGNEVKKEGVDIIGNPRALGVQKERSDWESNPDYKNQNLVY